MKKKPIVTMYTDGSGTGTPGVGAFAALLFIKNRQKVVVGWREVATNNSMELMAVIAGLRALQVPCEVKVFSDSKYVVNGFHSWSKTWIRKGWVTSEGYEVKNKDLWQTLLEVAAPHDVTIEWVKGHNGNKHNEFVDKVAKAERKKHVPARDKAPAPKPKRKRK